jgi:hypothetical protein
MILLLVMLKVFYKSKIRYSSIYLIYSFVFFYRSGYLSATECDKNVTVRGSRLEENNQSDTDD